MIPIEIHCPECQKAYLVDQNDLKVGFVRFQCELCSVVFGFQWPQPPGFTTIKTSRIDETVTLKSKSDDAPTQKCDHCGAMCATNYSECPKCGVIFEKVRRIRPPRPVQSPFNSEVTAMWDQIRQDYSNESKHEQFIKLCLAKNNLAFASSQYRAILQVNGSDELAKKMQNRIIDLATATYVSSAQNLRPPVDFARRKKVSMVIGISCLLILVGAAVEPARSLIAIGSAILAFTFLMKYFNSKQV